MPPRTRKGRADTSGTCVGGTSDVVSAASGPRLGRKRRLAGAETGGYSRIISAEAPMFTPRMPAVVFGLCAALASAPQAAADEPFYKGKRLTLIINFRSEERRVGKEGASGC